MICMSPYSIPLCTIFTKWPAPSSPTQSQQGTLFSTFAEMDWKISFTWGQAAGEPPGMIEGPNKAPSSPPETPVPMYNKPLLSTYFVRRVVSGKCVFPPSMMMSPSSKCGISCSMKSSTGLPAFTNIITLRGFFNDSHNSLIERVPIKFLPAPRPSMNLSTFSTVRLNTATV